MFEKMKFKRQVSKIMRACGGNENNPSVADQLVVSIIQFPLMSETGLSRFNKYVLADAAIISMFYSISKIDVSDEVFDSFSEELMSKMIYAINGVYELGMDNVSLLDIMTERGDYFISLFDNPATDFFNKSTELFSQDIYYGELKPITDEPNCLVLDMKTKMDISIATTAHFSGLFPVLIKIISKL